MAYTDLTSSFQYKTLLTATLMQQLAANDAYNLLPSGTKGVFAQAAAPTGWTQVTTNNDAALRVVNDGSGGGTGGTDSVATPTHTHSLSIGQALFAGGDGAQIVAPTGGGNMFTAGAAGGAYGAASSVSGAPSKAFKYVNVIVCNHT